MYGKFLENTSYKTDKYGFVNEKEIRIATGIALVLGFYSFISILFFGKFDIPMIFIGMIWFDFVLKVFWGPEKSIFGFFAKQYTKTEYWVGAVQKRFAWSLGLFLSTFAFFCILIVSGFLPKTLGIGTEIYEMINQKPVSEMHETVLNAEFSCPLPTSVCTQKSDSSLFAVPFSPPLFACILCLIFMSMEVFFGYCVGCKIYAKLVQWNIMKKIPNQHCANGVCERD